MRLASYNLLHGVAPSDGVVSADRLREAVASLDADVLAIQEVDRGQVRSGGVDQTAVCAEALGAPWSRFAATVAGPPGSTRPVPPETDVPGPAYGIGLVSRLPVLSWHELRLPSSRVPAVMPGNLPVRGGRGVRLGPPQLIRDEQRAVVAAVVETATGTMTVACTHLTYVQGPNVVQLRSALGLLRTLPAPRILLGDLNMAGRVPALVSRWRPLVRGRTFPAWRPLVQIDHALAEGPVALTGSEVVELPVADHRAIVVEVEVTRRAQH